MTILELSFPTSRYHATPWGRHVNEGVVEWPPSPWRILRALIATWYLKAHEIPEPTVRSLLEKLSAWPRFRLPPTTTGHTRHYMPGNEAYHKEGNRLAFGPSKTKIFDTFIQIEEDATILVAWDVDLTDDELAAFKELTKCLGYFGRAESLVVGRVLEGVTNIEANALPYSQRPPAEPEA